MLFVHMVFLLPLSKYCHSALILITLCPTASTAKGYIRANKHVLPSQVGTPLNVCNELADQLAKRGAAEHQTENQVTVHKQKTLIKATRKQRIFLLFVRQHYTWRAALEMKSVVFCSAATGPCSFSCNGAGVGQISSLSNR